MPVRTRGQRQRDPEGSQVASRGGSPPHAGRLRGARASTERRSNASRRAPSEEASVEDAGPAAPSRTPSPTVDEDTDEEHAELLRQVRAQRKQKEIEALKAELAGEDPAVDVEIPGVSLPIRKHRRHSSDADESSERAFLRSLKLSDTPVFHGKSQRELQTFNIGWKNIFRGHETAKPKYWTARINLVGQRLRGDAAVAWFKNKETYVSWETFLNFLRTTLADPAVRMAEALQALYSFKQGEHQRVRELVTEIERLEEDIPEMSEEVRKAWILLLAVKPATRTSVLSEHKEITSREQVLASASRHEQAQSLEDATRTKVTRTTHHETTRQETNANRNPPAPKAPERSTTTTTTYSGPRKVEEQSHTRVAERSQAPPSQSNSSGGRCYKCNGVGHYQNNCPNNRTSSNSHPASGVNAVKLPEGAKK